MNQMVEQKDLFRPRRSFKRLLAKEMFQLADWLRNNMDELKKSKVTRGIAAEKATEALGFHVRASGIEAAENMIGRKLPFGERSSPRIKEEVFADVEVLKAKVAVLEAQVRSLLMATNTPI
jgi:hypothetical protein